MCSRECPPAPPHHVRRLLHPRFFHRCPFALRYRLLLLRLLLLLLCFFAPLLSDCSFAPLLFRCSKQEPKSHPDPVGKRGAAAVLRAAPYKKAVVPIRMFTDAFDDGGFEALERREERQVEEMLALAELKVGPVLGSCSASLALRVA
eukprot:scaffold1474_cov256-Pinguiococcus_pyrenoidosus.AAC.10